MHRVEPHLGGHPVIYGQTIKYSGVSAEDMFLRTLKLRKKYLMTLVKLCAYCLKDFEANECVRNYSPNVCVRDPYEVHVDSTRTKFLGFTKPDYTTDLWINWCIWHEAML